MHLRRYADSSSSERIDRGSCPELFDDIGRYWYDDPANKTNGEFDVVTHDPHGYVFYEASSKHARYTGR